MRRLFFFIILFYFIYLFISFSNFNFALLKENTKTNMLMKIASEMPIVSKEYVLFNKEVYPMNELFFFLSMLVRL